MADSHILRIAEVNVAHADALLRGVRQHFGPVPLLVLWKTTSGPRRSRKMIWRLTGSNFKASNSHGATLVPENWAQQMVPGAGLKS